MRKLLSMGVALLMLLSLAAGALSEGAIERNALGESAIADEIILEMIENGVELPLVDEPITVTCMYPRPADAGDYDTMWFFQKVAEMTGITIEMQPVESAGWKEKKALAFASNELPDIFLSGITKDDENMYGPQGYLLPLGDLIAEHAPITNYLFGASEGAIKTLTCEDGNIYTAPMFVFVEREVVGGRRCYINTSWLEAVGMEKPTTLDEFYDVLVAFRDGDPNGNGEADEIPLSGASKGNTANMIMYAYGYADLRHDVKDDVYKYVPLQPEYRAYLEYMNKLFAEGLLDDEYVSQSGEQITAKSAAELIGITADTSGVPRVSPDQLVNYGGLGAMTSDLNDELTWCAQPTFNRGGTFAITANCPYPEEMIKLLDFFYTAVGSVMVRCGPSNDEVEGGWTMVQVDGVDTFETHYAEAGYTSFWSFRALHTVMSAPYLDSSETKVAQYLTYADPQQRWLTASVLVDTNNAEIARLAYPEVSFSEEEMEIINTYVDLDSYVDQMEAKFITGEASIDAEYDAFIARIQSMNVEEMVTIRQAAYDRWNAQ